MPALGARSILQAALSKSVSPVATCYSSLAGSSRGLLTCCCCSEWALKNKPTGGAIVVARFVCVGKSRKSLISGPEAGRLRVLDIPATQPERQVLRASFATARPKRAKCKWAARDKVGQIFSTARFRPNKCPSGIRRLANSPPPAASLMAQPEGQQSGGQKFIRSPSCLSPACPSVALQRRLSVCLSPALPSQSCTHSPVSIWCQVWPPRA